MRKGFFGLDDAVAAALLTIIGLVLGAFLEKETDGGVTQVIQETVRYVDRNETNDTKYPKIILTDNPWEVE